MKPLNQSERRLSFIYFTLLYVLGIVLAVMAAFWGMQVPLKENAVLRSEVEEYQKDLLLSHKFSLKLTETKEMLDKINKPGVDQPDLINSKITANLQSMYQLIGPDSTAHTNLYKDVISNLSSLQADKKEFRNSSKSDKEVQLLNEAIRERDNQINQLNNRIQADNLMMSKGAQ